MCILTLVTTEINRLPWAILIGNSIGWAYIPTALLFMWMAWRDANTASKEERELHENVSNADHPEISAHLLSRIAYNNIMLNKQRMIGVVAYSVIAIIFTFLQVLHAGNAWPDSISAAGVYLSSLVVAYSAIRGRSLTYLYGSLPPLFAFAAGMYMSFGLWTTSILYFLLTLSMMGTYTVMVKSYKFNKKVLSILDDIQHLRFARAQLDKAIQEYNAITNSFGKETSKNN